MLLPLKESTIHIKSAVALGIAIQARWSRQLFCRERFAMFQAAGLMGTFAGWSTGSTAKQAELSSWHAQQMQLPG